MRVEKGAEKDGLLKIRESNSKQLSDVLTDVTTGNRRGAGFPMRWSKASSLYTSFHSGNEEKWLENSPSKHISYM